ncbi:hypothetical protein [Arthrobacter sp.]|uniref:hypothetical protein n=1 Tax=Arthrobacter sp. TaxID=1667 RepID=UPI0028114BF3|nr:hypothetical protein [Arthrobacter sp.]
MTPRNAFWEATIEEAGTFPLDASFEPAENYLEQCGDDGLQTKIVAPIAHAIMIRFPSSRVTAAQLRGRQFLAHFWLKQLG